MVQMLGQVTIRDEVTVICPAQLAPGSRTRYASIGWRFVGVRL